MRPRKTTLLAEAAPVGWRERPEPVWIPARLMGAGHSASSTRGTAVASGAGGEKRRLWGCIQYRPQRSQKSTQEPPEEGPLPAAVEGDAAAAPEGHIALINLCPVPTFHFQLRRAYTPTSRRSGHPSSANAGSSQRPVRAPAWGTWPAGPRPLRVGTSPSPRCAVKPSEIRSPASPASRLTGFGRTSTCCSPG